MAIKATRDSNHTRDILFPMRFERQGIIPLELMVASEKLLDLANVEKMKLTSDVYI